MPVGPTDQIGELKASGDNAAQTVQQLQQALHDLLAISRLPRRETTPHAATVMPTCCHSAGFVC